MICDIVYDISMNMSVNMVNNGDLILFRYNNWELTKVLAYYTHVAIVVKKNNVAYILEIIDALDDSGKKGIGVQLHKMSERLLNYNGVIHVAPIKFDISKKAVARVFEEIGWLKKHIHFPKMYQLEYAKRCLCTRCFNNDLQRSGMFCTQFVAYILQEYFHITCTHPYKLLSCLLPDDMLDVKALNKMGRYIKIFRKPEMLDV